MKIVEPVPPLARARHEAREWARTWFHARGRAGFSWRADKVRRAGGVNYGWLDEPVRAEETRIGGGVKLDHLRARFGESREAFGILYLVSSVLHLVPHPEVLVRRCRERGIKLVWNQNGVAYPAWCGDFYPWFNEPMRRLIAQADHVIYQSAFCRESADRYLGPIGVASEILWNPVDLAHFSPAKEPPSGESWQLLAMGTSHAFYRVKAAIDCLEELVLRGRAVRLTLAGELRWRGGEEETREYLNALGMTAFTEFRPRFSQTEAPRLYRRAHVLLHAKYKDPCPTVPIEAMACGVPVVGSRSGGMPELVPSSAGVLVDVVDDWTLDHAPAASAMADGVERIMARHDEFARAARLHAETSFDRDRWVDRHEEVFRKLEGA